MPFARGTAGLVTLLLVASSLGCSGHADRPTAPKRGGDPQKGTYTQKGAYTQKGKASWYGPQFHGRDTASGERFDMNLPSAAHRSLPFGTVVRVENLDNGRVIDVRINDRGPFVRGRILDLSRAAARELDMIGAGIATVRLRVVAWPDQPVLTRARGRSTEQTPARATETVQAGAFLDLERAQRLAARVRRRDRRARVYSDAGWHRVQVRGLTAKEAQRLRSRLRADGIESVLVDG